MHSRRVVSASVDLRRPKAERGGRNWSEKGEEGLLIAGKHHIHSLLSCTRGRGRGDEREAIIKRECVK
jgi:hypothetical protein